MYVKDSFEDGFVHPCINVKFYFMMFLNIVYIENLRCETEIFPN